MSKISKKISKRKLIKALKGEFEEPTWTRETLSEFLARPMSQEEWLKGYNKWKKQMEDNTLSTPLAEYEFVENLGKKKRRRKKNVND
jgi:hypothetical protein